MREESCMSLTFKWGCLGNAYSWLSYVLFCSAFSLHLTARQSTDLCSYSFAVAFKTGTDSPDLTRPCSGSCGSAEADWLDLAPSWGLSADTEQVWLLFRHGINRRKKEILENVFKCFFFFQGGTTLNITQTYVVSLEQLLKAKPL